MRMTPTYSSAQHVLILDSEPQTLHKGMDLLEVRGHMALCAWRTRYWTFNKLSISRKALFQKLGITGSWNMGPQRSWAYERSLITLRLGRGAAQNQLRVQLEDNVCLRLETLPRKLPFDSFYHTRLWLSIFASLMELDFMSSRET